MEALPLTKPLTEPLLALLRSAAECPRLGYPVWTSEHRQIEALIESGYLVRRPDNHSRVLLTELGRGALERGDSGEANH